MSIADVFKGKKTTSQLQEDVARKVAIQEQIERLNQEKTLIDERLRGSLPMGSTPIGDWDVQLRANRRLNAARFEEAYPVVKHPELYKPALNMEKVKDAIAPAALDAFYDNGTPVVVIR